ncbi:hypothetical protein C6W18_06680 [Bacillus sp. LLTC93]|nr:hypothetical protein [Bacillus zhangzhouensis]PRO41690.1 hypothetical protein C6W18_06680 [Bacillus sp. LLTC93]
MRTLKTRFIRWLRTRDVEFFQVISHDSKESAFLLYLDQRRSQDGNHIDVFLISHFDLSEETYEDVLSFNNDMLGSKPNCSYCMDTISVEEEFEFDFPCDMLAIQRYVDNLLKRVQANKLPALTEKDFNYLSQQ